MTDYTDPTTVDVGEVMANINHDYRMRGHSWTDRLSWPNVTVKALADEIERLRHALTNVANNLYDAEMISDVARDNILRAALNTPANV